jgi:hypothetical protein
MSEKEKKLPSTAWEKGQSSPNKYGRGGNPDKPKTKSKPVSTLRKTLSKLRNLEVKSLENVEKSVNGEAVDKESLASSKWVLTTIVTVQRACVSEELAVHGIKSDLENESEEVEKEDEEPKVRFQLHCLPTKADLE